jgi:hypothetical protein
VLRGEGGRGSVSWTELVGLRVARGVAEKGKLKHPEYSRPTAAVELLDKLELEFQSKQISNFKLLPIIFLFSAYFAHISSAFSISSFTSPHLHPGKVWHPKR